MSGGGSRQRDKPGTSPKLLSGNSNKMHFSSRNLSSLALARLLTVWVARVSARGKVIIAAKQLFSHSEDLRTVLNLFLPENLRGGMREVPTSKHEKQTTEPLK